MSQSKQLGKQFIKLRQLRYRKLTLVGGNTIVAYNSTKQRSSHFQLPGIESQQNNDSPKKISQLGRNIYDQQVCRRSNFRALKALIRTYEEKKRKNSNQSGQIELSIKKLNWTPNQQRSTLTKKSYPKMNSKFSIKSKNIIPLNVIPKINLKYQNNNKNNESGSSENEEISGIGIGKAYRNYNSYAVLQNQKYQYTNNFTIINKLEEATKSSQKNNIKNPTSKIPKNTHHELQSIVSYHNKNSQKKQQYLYQKLANKSSYQKQEMNMVYERRIRSYTDFLFKLFYAHNIYIDLDLRNAELSAKSNRIKCYFGPGNNSAMVKGLIKRRYWWQFTDDINQASFIWTQSKCNDLFKKQNKREIQTNNQYKRQYKKCKQQIQQKSTLYNKTDSFRKNGKKNSFEDRSLSPNKNNNKSRMLKKMNRNQEFNFKILNEEDIQSYQFYYEKYQTQTFNKKPLCYSSKLQKCPKSMKQLSLQCTIAHNHFPQNHNLGNKKALFYNLQQYYKLIEQDPFDYLPLTFHIKNGFKDPQYNRFQIYYNKRNNIIKKQIQQMQEQYGEGYEANKKTRNIWIVKPGENSNQGRGITVIDQIYELNNIIKRIGEDDSKSQSPTKTIEPQKKRTYIVQMYIDRPFLYNNRKFDIRHYMLITNLHGIKRAYWYQQGYIRTSSYEFKIDNFEPEIHLTNDFIQKKYPQYGRYEPCNKISYEQFQRYVDTNYSSKKYSFKNQVLPKMKSMATDAAKSVFLKLSPENLEHNFEIFGLDFMIDRHFQPWLIQINTNPCLECNCPLLDRIVPYMVEQSLKLTIDVIFPPPSHYPNTCKHNAPMIDLQTFKYQLIFDQITDGQQVKELYGVSKNKKLSKNRKYQPLKILDSNDIGDLDDDQWFGDDGKEIRLDDYT